MRILRSREDFWEVTARVHNEAFAFDTESDGPQLIKGNMLNVHRSRLVGFSIAFMEEGDTFYVPYRHGGEPNRETIDLLKAVGSTSREVWAHNWKHDATVLKREGVEPPKNARDSLIMMWLLEESANGRYGLKALAETFLDMEMVSYKETLGVSESWSQLPVEVAAPYAVDDVLAVRGLVQLFYAELRSRGQEDAFLSVEMPLVFCLRDMEANGFSIDYKSLEELAEELEDQVKVLRDEWEWLFPDVLISSSVQVSDYFYGNGLWPVKGVPKGKSGRHSTGRRWTEQAARLCPKGSMGSLAAEIRLEFQDLSKYLSTFTHTLVDQAAQHGDWRIRCSFRQHGTATGRLSCAGPNLQNIPARTELGKRIRRSFAPVEPRVLVCADYSQIELRVLAHLAGEGRLMEAYREGADIHQRTADLVGCSRQQAKTVNFATVYGARPKKLAEQLGVSKYEATKFMLNYHAAYPEVETLRQRIVKDAYENGFVTTLGGRRRKIPQLVAARHRNPQSEAFEDKLERWFGERIAFNTPVQGGAADIVKRAMLDFHAKDLGLMVHLVSQVHDELVVECPKHKAQTVAEELELSMVNAFPLKVPLLAEPKVGKTWDDCK